MKIIYLLAIAALCVRFHIAKAQEAAEEPPLEDMLRDMPESERIKLLEALNKIDKPYERRINRPEYTSREDYHAKTQPPPHQPNYQRPPPSGAAQNTAEGIQRVQTSMSDAWSKLTENPQLQLAIQNMTAGWERALNGLREKMSKMPVYDDKGNIVDYADRSYIFDWVATITGGVWTLTKATVRGFFSAATTSRTTSYQPPTQNLQQGWAHKHYENARTPPETGRHATEFMGHQGHPKDRQDHRDRASHHQSVYSDPNHQRVVDTEHPHVPSDHKHDHKYHPEDVAKDIAMDTYKHGMSQDEVKRIEDEIRAEIMAEERARIRAEAKAAAEQQAQEKATPKQDL